MLLQAAHSWVLPLAFACAMAWVGQGGMGWEQGLLTPSEGLIRGFHWC